MREFRLETLQVQLADDARMPLLDQELACAGFELAFDQSDFALGEPKAADVLFDSRFRIGEEDLGCGLFDDRPADGALQGVARALRRGAEHTIEFPPDLQSILGELFELFISQEPRELIGPAHEPPSIQELADAVKQILRDGYPNQFVIEKIRDVEADQRLAHQPIGDGRA